MSSSSSMSATSVSITVSLRFDDMEAELVEEAKEDKDLPEGVEQVVQTFITMVRQMMAGQERQLVKLLHFYG